MKPFNERFKANGFSKPSFEEFKQWFSGLSIPQRNMLEIATARDKNNGLKKHQVRQVTSSGSMGSNVTMRDIYNRYVSHVLGF